MVRTVDKRFPKDSTEDEAPAKPKQTRNRVPRQLPTMADSGSVKDLTFKLRDRSTKYGEIIDAIHKLKHNQYISFTTSDGEDVMSLKSRIGSLVSRVCKAPEGLRYRTRATADDHVVVFAERIPEGEEKKAKTA